MRENRKIVSALLTAAALAAVSPSAVWAHGCAYRGGEAPGWQQTEENGTRRWRYWNQDGGCARDCRKEIDGKLYFFDESGTMLSGWIDGEGNQLTDDGTAYMDGIYYCGSPDEGAAAEGWKYLPVQRDHGGMEQRWFYFYSNGKKAADTSITESDENGRYRYTFDEYGIMRSSKKISSSPAVLTEQWIERIPKASQDPYASEHHIKRWYYGLSDGTVVQNRMRTIGGEEYLFDQAGIMRAGLVAVTKNKKYGETLICTGDSTDCDAEDLEQYLDEYDLMYFDEKSGAKQTGTVEIVAGGEICTFEFHKSGKAVHGPYGGKLYRAGVLQKAEDVGKYEIRTVDDEDYLVNRSGQIQGPGRYRDGGMVWFVERKNGQYEITAEE